MKHLSPAEFVDLLDGKLETARAGHAAECRQCREQSDALRDAVIDAASPPPPVPSPLFWEHFSARVSASIRNERAQSRAARWSARFGRPAFSVSLAAAVVALVTLAAVSTPPAVAPIDDSPEIAGTAADTFWTDDDVEADEAWALVRSATEGIEWDEAAEAGITLPPGAAARAAGELTDAERGELARLIEDDIKRTGA